MRMRKTILILLLIGLLIAPALADDSSLIVDSGWQGIENRLTVRNATNPIQSIIYPFLPDWALGGNDYPEGVAIFYMDGDPAWLAWNESSGEFPRAFLAGRVDDLEGPGEWDWDVRFLNAESHYFKIYKTDHVNLLGLGYSDINITEYPGEIRWFNTTMSQPRLPLISAPAVWFTLAFNVNSSEYGFVVFDKTRYLNLIPGMLPVSQNFPTYIEFDGPGNMVGVIHASTYEVLLKADQKMTQEAPDLFGEMIAIATTIWTVMGLLWILLDWFVLKAGFIFVVLILELGMAAYYANTSKDIFVFYRRFIKGNKSMFEFFSSLFNAITQIIVNIKNIIPFLKYI